MNIDNGIWFLLLNASVVWAVLGAVLMWVLRVKAVVLLVVIAPFIIGTSFLYIEGAEELMGFYSTSLVYGIPGLVIGVLWVDYIRVKAYFQRASMSSFVARIAISLSGLYMLSYFGQKILLNNPMVSFVLDFLNEGEKAKELMSKVDYDGVEKAGMIMAGGFAVIAFNAFMERRRAQKEMRNRQERT